MLLRSILISLCALCVLLGVREQNRTFSVLLPLRGCSGGDADTDADASMKALTGDDSSANQPTRITPAVVMATTTTTTTTRSTPDEENDCQCYLPLNQEFKGQSGQDQYLFQRVFFPQGALCCRGIFVEFGARNGITHSNTYVFEKNLGWKGLLFEVDAKEHAELVQNRPHSDVVLGPVCPSHMDNVTIVLSNIPGYTGTQDSYEPSRYVEEDVRDEQVFQCHHLAKELKARNMHRIDYMTIDTEGSEPDIVKDFPWNDFDVRVVQIEQLLASQFPSQVGKKEAMIAHLESFGYRLLSEFPVGGGLSTQDLIFTRNLDSVLKMTASSEKPSRIWPHEPKDTAMAK